jgi:hypothetical protein
LLPVQEELPELDELVRTACPHDVRGVETKQGKANVLMQVCVDCGFAYAFYCCQYVLVGLLKVYAGH